MCFRGIEREREYNTDSEKRSSVLERDWIEKDRIILQREIETETEEGRENRQESVL